MVKYTKNTTPYIGHLDNSLFPHIDKDETPSRPLRDLAPLFASVNSDKKKKGVKRMGKKSKKQ
jgi:hypothetical protein